MVDRRSLVVGAAAGTVAAASSFPKPAIAQAAPEIRWRCTSSFPKSLDTIYSAAEVFARHVAAATDGKFQIQVFAAGEIVPGLQAADVVTNGTVEMCHTSSYYYWGKDPTFAFGTNIPFGLNARMNNAWFYDRDGIAQLNNFYKKYNIYGLPCGNTGCQMGGWFRKEIKSTADLQGLKMRIGGFGGAIIQKLGVVPQQIAAGDIYPSLEKGTIDAAEWVGPYDDEKLGFNKVAQYYYYPGWWEGGPALYNFINIDRWNELPKNYQEIVYTASATASAWMLARYDSLNPGAIRRLAAAGVQFRPFPQDVMEAAYRAALQTYDEVAATNADFKAIYENQTAFRNEEYLWWQVAELTLDNFMVRARSIQAKG